MRWTFLTYGLVNVSSSSNQCGVGVKSLCVKMECGQVYTSILGCVGWEEAGFWYWCFFSSSSGVSRISQK